MNPDRIRAAVARLVTFLSSLDGDDRERGLSAAQNIGQTLALLHSDFEQGVANLQYDVGGKGILDWIWTDEHRSQIEHFSDEIYELIRPVSPETRHGEA